MEESRINKKETHVNNIVEQYCYQRNTFFPNKPSPNLFLHKLELRMQQYYSQLIRRRNSEIK